jgi:hypothetical protein
MALGAIFFVILATGSFGIARFTMWISGLGAPPEIVYACWGVEYFLLLTDILCVVVFVVAQTRNYIVRSWQDGK